MKRHKLLIETEDLVGPVIQDVCMGWEGTARIKKVSVISRCRIEGVFIIFRIIIYIYVDGKGRKF